MKNIYVKINNQYCESFSINCFVSEDWIRPLLREDFDYEDFDQNYQIYYVDNEGYLAKDFSKQEWLHNERLVIQLRNRRQFECFSIINRGKFWYDKLSQEQLKELEQWYQAWLDVTETMIVPETPIWINEQ